MTLTKPLLPSYERYILAGLGDRTILFPDGWVSEILLIDRNAILAVPFYNAAMLGITHHQGNAIPILSLQRTLINQQVVLPERLTVAYLTRQAGELSGAGLTVDRVMGSMNAAQYAQLLDELETNHKMTMTYLRIEEIAPKLPRSLWQPQRWIER